MKNVSGARLLPMADVRPLSGTHIDTGWSFLLRTAQEKLGLVARKSVVRPGRTVCKPSQIPPYFDHVRPELLAMIPLSSRSVLEIGCGRGTNWAKQ